MCLTVEYISTTLHPGVVSQQNLKALLVPGVTFRYKNCLRSGLLKCLFQQKTTQFRNWV